MQAQHGRLFTTQFFLDTGRTEMELRWGLRKGKWIRVVRRVYALGTKAPTVYEVAVARVMAGAAAPARGLVSARLLGLDSISIPRDVPRLRGALVSPEPVLVDGVWCANGLQTIVDIAPFVDDLVWEQANESALFKKLFKLEELESIVPLLSASRIAGAPRIRRVLALRPMGAPPTESLLETLAVQMARATEGVPEPTRQHVVEDEGEFVARVDLSWPDIGAFHELDGEHHAGQPVYDANRESRVVAATGWLCARMAWTEVRCHPTVSGRRLARILEQARRRPQRD
jgi:hypothetical protein